MLGANGEPYSPRHLRSVAAELIARESAGLRYGFLMETAGQRHDEDDAGFFRRLELDNRVDAYFVILPARAKVLGTVFEGGLLVRDFHFGRDPRIVLFVEARLLDSGFDGRFEFVAKGKRTRYLRSLVARAQSVIRWADVEGLFESIVAWSRTDP